MISSWYLDMTLQADHYLALYVTFVFLNCDSVEVVHCYFKQPGCHALRFEGFRTANMQQGVLLVVAFWYVSALSA